MPPSLPTFCSSWDQDNNGVADNQFLCMEDDPSGTPPRESLCDVNCRPCPMTSYRKLGVDDHTYHAKRWYRPDKILPSRDAEGIPHHMSVAERVHRYPLEWHGERAACFTSRGHECWGAVCACDGGNEVYGSGPITGLIPDCFNFKGYDYGQSQSWMECRTETARDIGTLPVRLSSGRGSMFQAMFSRASGLSGHSQGAFPQCTSNLLAMCIGKQHDNDCLAQQEPDFHNAGPGREAWRRFFVEDIGATIDAPPEVNAETLAEAAVRNIKNRAIVSIEADRLLGQGGVYHFDQMEHLAFDTNPNGGSLGVWDRRYTPNEDEGCPTNEPFITLDGSHLRYSGHPVRVEIGIRRAFISLHLVLHKVNVRRSPINYSSDPQLWPSVRMRLAATFWVRAYLDTPAIVTRPGGGEEVELSIQNGTPPLSCGTMPKVLPLDEVEYVHQGQSITPPSGFEWFGLIGALSSGSGEWQNVLDEDNNPSGGSIVARCCQATRALEDVVVPGFPTMPGMAEQKQHFGGTIRVGLNPAAGGCE